MVEEAIELYEADSKPLPPTNASKSILGVLSELRGEIAIEALALR
jgi:hypothetical protein